MNSALVNVLQKNKSNFRSVVDFNPAKEKLVKLDFTEVNTELAVTDVSSTEKFSQYINNKLTQANAKFGIGGYNENRILYKRSKLFEGTEERTIHLGIDIWGTVGTKVHVPVGGVVHSFAFNNNFGDYGATIILQHQLDTIVFYTLYGHLSLNDLNNLKEGKYISRGEVLAHFGAPNENGDWPPHLHFQIINDIRLNKGDYPGVCTLSESEKYLDNCPDPDLILDMMKYAV
jgi:murein DD-endopeptidase MepM/ murein hydrolase activator NlpD